LTTHGTSYLGLIMRLGGVYETRGDSSRPLRKSDITRHANRQKLKTKTPETPETPETKNKNPKSTPTTVLKLINKINKQITE
ncbi:hypothetical protein, partial [Pseudomonas aeruginosa]|uniref:hypothetical protein n=1 Tax=Pseudomonas aeruginosa TaxID=287 RepID=UPI003982D438